MNYFLYKIEHDYGLAPNPFHGYCTLAVCKSQIRRSQRLAIGDWIIGTGSKSLSNINRIIFAMKVDEILSFNEYWLDTRFESKKPKVNGSLVQMYGDNFYHYDEVADKWIQENSAHSNKNGEVNLDHLNRDTEGEKVLVSNTFYYFGSKAIKLPNYFYNEMNGDKLRNYKLLNTDTGDKFIEWLSGKYKLGIYGDPSSWSLHL